MHPLYTTAVSFVLGYYNLPDVLYIYIGASSLYSYTKELRVRIVCERESSLNVGVKICWETVNRELYR